MRALKKGDKIKVVKVGKFWNICMNKCIGQELTVDGDERVEHMGLIGYAVQDNPYIWYNDCCKRVTKKGKLKDFK